MGSSQRAPTGRYGPAVGAGLVTGHLADISVVSRHRGRSNDAARRGVPAGDGAAIRSPLLLGMAKAMYCVLSRGAPSPATKPSVLGLCQVASTTTAFAQALRVPTRLSVGAQSAAG